jgi:hypothetical protein
VDRFSSLLKVLCGSGLCSGLVIRRHVRSDLAQAPKPPNRFFDVTDFFDVVAGSKPERRRNKSGIPAAL